MTRLEVTRTERVILTLDGRFERLFGPGVHWVWTGFALAEWTRIDLSKTVVEGVALVDAVPRGLNGTVTLTVGARERLVVVLNGGLFRTFGAGTWRIWTEAGEVRHIVLDVEARPEPLTETDALLGHRGPWTEAEVAEGSALVLLRDAEPVEVVEAGRLRIWNGTRWGTRTVDLALRALELAAQDLLTADPITLRVKPVVTWRVTDPLVFARNDTVEAMIWTAVQLALREVVGAKALEELQADKRALDEALTERTRELLPGLGVAVERASVKDIVLPGEVKDILKKVTVARKEAEAQAIRRREEVAHTRQLLNTAKLLESNPTLRRLKELDKLAEIAESVGEVKLVLGGDELKKLTLSD